MMGLSAVVIIVMMCVGDDDSKCKREVFAPVTPGKVQNVKEFCDDFMLQQLQAMSKSPATKNVRVSDYICLPQAAHVMLPDSIAKRLMR